MLTIRYETGFKKDFKRIIKRGYDGKLLEVVVGNAGKQGSAARQIQMP